jgi:predicted enzyme related to lactoylglutathione lyase
MRRLRKMNAKGVSWVGIKTEEFVQMRAFFAEVVGLEAMFEDEDFVVFGYPNGDKVEIFGPRAGNPPEQFANNQVVTSILVDDIKQAISELKAAGTELVGDLQGGTESYAWQHFRAPDGKVFELVCDPTHP